jgi:phosphonate transport system substrate-binding protein
MSCRSQEEAIPVDSPPVQTLRIGLIPEHNLFSQKRRYEPLAEYLSREVGARIVLKILSRYGNIIENFVSIDLDGAFFGSFTGALAHKRLGVEALARPEYADGTSTYHGLLFVRRDRGISSGKDMRGKRFAFVDKATTAGWLLPLHYFKTQGIDDHRSWLKEVYFTGTHEGAIYDVLENKADIGAAKNTVFQRLARSDPRLSDELTILARSPDVPENALCVRRDLGDALKTKLKETLLNMHQEEEGRQILDSFGAARFIPTTEEDYRVVFEFAAGIDLDLDTYDYIND